MRDDMVHLRALPAKGTYTLIISLSRDLNLEIGNLGPKEFPAGHYAYTGSGMGKGSSSLRGRVTRHLRRSKRKYWHIDYLLGNANAVTAAVVAAQTERRLECHINKSLKHKEKATTPVKGFGASDCKDNCVSHLLLFPNVTEGSLLVDRVAKHYRDVCLSATVVLVPDVGFEMLEFISSDSRN